MSATATQSSWRAAVAARSRGTTSPGLGCCRISPIQSPLAQLQSLGPPAQPFRRSEGFAMPRQNLKHVTTVFIVDAVEPCVAFWVDRFGFRAENQVPGADGKLMFASVKQGEIEVMYQTLASVLAENPAAAAVLQGHSVDLFISVDYIFTV